MATNATSNVLQLSPLQLRRTVDKYAAVKAEIAKLQKSAEFLVDLLKENGDGEYVGSKHRVLVATSDVTKLDIALVKGCLTPQQVIACSSTSSVQSARLYPL